MNQLITFVVMILLFVFLVTFIRKAIAKKPTSLLKRSLIIIAIFIAGADAILMIGFALIFITSGEDLYGKTGKASSSQSEKEAASPDENGSTQSDASNSKNEATTATASDGTQLFIYPLDGPADNIIFSGENLDVYDLTLVSTEDISNDSKALHFEGKIKNHSGRDYEMVAIGFCLCDKDDNMLTDSGVGGYDVIGDSTNYIKDSEEYEFSVVIAASKYVYDHAESVAMYYLTTTG